MPFVQVSSHICVIIPFSPNVCIGTTTAYKMGTQVPVCVPIHGAIHYISSTTNSARFDHCVYKTCSLLVQLSISFYDFLLEVL